MEDDVAPLDRKALVRLARAGAEARLAALRVETAAILRMFPDLQGGKNRTAAREAAATRAAGASQVRRRGWTAAQRKEAADRMRKYWATKKTSGAKRASGKK